jgi:hypothetical protein
MDLGTISKNLESLYKVKKDRYYIWPIIIKYIYSHCNFTIRKKQLQASYLCKFIITYKEGLKNSGNGISAHIQWPWTRWNMHYVASSSMFVYLLVQRLSFSIACICTIPCEKPIHQQQDGTKFHLLWPTYARELGVKLRKRVNRC